jgi:hypothetical protein
MRGTPLHNAAAQATKVGLRLLRLWRLLRSFLLLSLRCFDILLSSPCTTKNGPRLSRLAHPRPEFAGLVVLRPASTRITSFRGLPAEERAAAQLIMMQLVGRPLYDA